MPSKEKIISGYSSSILARCLSIMTKFYIRLEHNKYLYVCIALEQSHTYK